MLQRLFDLLLTEGAATTAAAVADFSAIAVALIVQAAWAMGAYTWQWGYSMGIFVIIVMLLISPNQVTEPEAVYHVSYHFAPEFMGRYALNLRFQTPLIP